MRNLIKQSFIWFIVVGSIAWATSIITGNSLPTFITPYTIEIGSYTKVLYKLDVYNYLKQIENITINVPIEEMFYSPPGAPDLSNVADVLKLLPNLFIWYFNLLMWWFNTILIAPTKLLIQPLLFICTVLGIDLNSNGIVRLINAIYGVTMPVIQYI